MRTLSGLAIVFATLCLLLLSGCAGGVTETGNPSRSYVTTSADGFGTWDVNDASFSAEWNVTSPSSGAVLYTYRLGGACDEPTTYGFRPCALFLIQCLDAGASCTGAPVPGELFYLLEIPGSALMVYVPTSSELHVGVLRGDCTSDISGDYTSMPTGLVSTNLFGMYRTDSTFTSIIGSDFTLVNPASPSLSYTTLSSGGTGALTISGSTCSGGIRDFSIYGIPVRATMMSGGLWSFAFPAGLGGAVSFRSDLAAQSADLAGKTLYGFVSADDAPTAMARLELGPLSGGRIPYSKLLYSTGLAPGISGQYITSAKEAGALYGFNGIPPGAAMSGITYATNLLQPTYPTPGDVTGLFVNPVGATVADGTIMTAMKSNGRVLVLGLRFGNRSGTLKATGSLVLFEQ